MPITQEQSQNQWDFTGGQGTNQGNEYSGFNIGGNWSAPNYNFSDPSIWGRNEQEIANMFNQQGMATNTQPAWQAAQAEGENQLRKMLANANEQFSMGRQRWGTGAANTFSQGAEDAGLSLASQRLAMELQAQEAARARQMQAMGYANQLGGQQADYQLGQANYGLGASGLELQNQQNQWNNQMGLMNMLFGYGNQMQNIGQSSLDRMYADWGAENSMPYLNSMLQWGNSYPPGSAVTQQSPLGGILGGLASLIPGVGGLFGMLGGGGGNQGGTQTGMGTSAYQPAPSYGGYNGTNYRFGMYNGQ